MGLAGAGVNQAAKPCRLGVRLKNKPALFVGLISVGWFGQLGGFKAGLLFGVELDIPQQGAVFQALLGFLRMFFNIIVDKLGGVGFLVVHEVLLVGRAYNSR